MNSLVSWQLLLFLCATSFGETFNKVAPAEDPRPTGQRLGPRSLLAAWEQRPRPGRLPQPPDPRAPERGAGAEAGGPVRLQLNSFGCATEGGTPRPRRREGLTPPRSLPRETHLKPRKGLEHGVWAGGGREFLS
ncbi:metastasis-suppressor KiSS-1 [Choloepus didactylus]|uniref:metastasis-suppressor KiSS-1 n=1 Tax=Choloepus didactylus TaxID=27675 RepID=UPI00189FDC3B|nr:metastasis-suppressor KiSS-1 [Choloepus didactylus]